MNPTTRSSRAAFRLPARKAGAWAVVFHLTASSAAQADDLGALFEPRSLVSVGGLVGTSPRFHGARQNAVWALPYLSIRGPDEPRHWWSPDDALDASLYQAGPVEIGAVLDLREGRATRGDPRLAGLPRRPMAAAAGLFAEVWPVADTIRLRAEVTQGLRDRDGVVAKLGADWVASVGRFTFSGGPRLVIGDEAASRLDFDVPVRSALLNPVLAPFRASAGPRSVGVTGAVSYAWSEAWQMLAYARYDRLVGSAAASPIVQRSRAYGELSIGSGLIHTFALEQ